MTDELTTKMHSEFNVSNETNIKLTSFMALDRMNEFNYSIEKTAILFGLTVEKIKSYEAEFLELIKND